MIAIFFFLSLFLSFYFLSFFLSYNLFIYFLKIVFFPSEWLAYKCLLCLWACSKKCSMRRILRSFSFKVPFPTTFPNHPKRSPLRSSRVRPPSPRKTPFLDQRWGLFFTGLCEWLWSRREISSTATPPLASTSSPRTTRTRIARFPCYARRNLILI